MVSIGHRLPQLTLFYAFQKMLWLCLTSTVLVHTSLLILSILYNSLCKRRHAMNEFTYTHGGLCRAFNYQMTKKQLLSKFLLVHECHHYQLGQFISSWYMKNWPLFKRLALKRKKRHLNIDYEPVECTNCSTDLKSPVWHFLICWPRKIFRL